MKRNAWLCGIVTLMLVAGCAQQKKAEQTTTVVPVSSEATIVAQGEATGKTSLDAMPLAPSQPSGIQVDEAVFCTGVKDRVPQGVSESFDSPISKVFFFTRIRGAKQQTAVTHVWYWNEKKVAEVPLDVCSDNWRTWSSKKIDPSWKGPWAVKVLDQNGEVVAVKNFTIR